MSKNFYSEKKEILYFGMILIPFLCFFIGFEIGGASATKTDDDTTSKTAVSSTLGQVKNKKNINLVLDSLKDNKKHDINLELFWQIHSILKKDYLYQEKVEDKEKLSFYAIKGLVSGLDDRHSYFMTPKENKEFDISIDGELEGIGAALTLKEEILTISDVLKDTPAQKVGLLPDDIILEIDGETTEEQSLDDSVDKIRGEKGSTVKLTIYRFADDDKFDVEIKRDTIIIKSVTMEEVDDGKILLISLNKFSDDTIEEFMDLLQKEFNKKYDGMIIDLRFNGGGYLHVAIDLISKFVEKGVAVRTKSKIKESETKVSGKCDFPKIPLVVLVNAGTASASEIFAGAVQDHKRAKIIGEKSYGKGTVQEVKTFEKYDNASLRYTIEEWFTPNNRVINKKGIDPDFVVERTLEDFKNDKDPQLEAGIEYLKTKKVSEKFLKKKEEKDEKED